MFYWFYSYLHINLFSYISVRAALAFVISFLLCVYLMPKFIKWAKNKKVSQPIYELAPSTHLLKKGIPSMGGVVFVFSALIASLLSVKWNNFYVYGALLVIITFTLIGLKDDLSKIIHKKNTAGLSPRAKLILQILAGLAVSCLLYFYGHSTTLFVPFDKHPLINMHFFALLLWILVIVASSNALNLTDGLDGLATVPSIMSFFTLSVLVYVTSNSTLGDYLLLPHIVEVGEVAIIGAAFIGSLLAFLWYNCYPAEVFMGDSGSLPLGAFMGYLAIISKNEILLILIGFIFVLETMSVILQVGSFKLRKKRVFLMAPIHHHFEKKGWKENKVIIRFWIIAFMSNLAALITLKLR